MKCQLLLFTGGWSKQSNSYIGGADVSTFDSEFAYQQTIQRFREISDGNLNDIEGRQINLANLRYTGYLIADLKPSLHKQVYGRYYSTTDNEGYFFNLAHGNGYIEIISYDKLVKDAGRRNRILFEKPGVQKH